MSNKFLHKEVISLSSFFSRETMIIQNIVFEMRFPTKLVLLDRQSIDRLKRNVKHILTLENYSDQTVSFLENQRVAANVTLDNINLAFKEPIDMEYSIKIIKEFVPTAAAVFEMTGAKRLGFRITAILEKDNLHEANNTFFDIMKIDRDKFETVGDIAAFQLGTTIQNGKIFAAINISPAQQFKVEVSTTNGVTSGNGKSAVMVDTDIFVMGSPVDMNLPSFLNAANNTFLINVFKFLELVG